jgi:hypothetical protein
MTDTWSEDDTLIGKLKGRIAVVIGGAVGDVFGAAKLR